MRSKIQSPIHPGEVLQADFLAPMGVSQCRLAKGICVSPRRINEVVQGKRGITEAKARLGVPPGRDAQQRQPAAAPHAGRAPRPRRRGQSDVLGLTRRASPRARRA